MVAEIRQEYATKVEEILSIVVLILIIAIVVIVLIKPIVSLFAQVYSGGRSIQPFQRQSFYKKEIQPSDAVKRGLCLQDKSFIIQLSWNCILFFYIILVNKLLTISQFLVASIDHRKVKTPRQTKRSKPPLQNRVLSVRQSIRPTTPRLDITYAHAPR